MTYNSLTSTKARRYGVAVVLILAVISGLLLRSYIVSASDSGALSPGTMADDAAVGTSVWTNPNNAKVSDNVYATGGNLVTGPTVDTAVRIVKSDTTISTTNRSVGSTWSSTESYVSFGGATDKWGETWTIADINDVDFGVVFSAISDEPIQTHYLKATNFGFSIPAGATIDGIFVEIERKMLGNTPNVDHIRITVYYTEGGAPASQTMVSPVIIFE